MAQLYNRTRRSSSIPRTLLRRGRLLELPLYFLLRTSDLAREGLENSGSYRFADHIYRGQPSGRWLIGPWIDAAILRLPACRSFRNRFLNAREQLLAFLKERTRSGVPLNVLSVPCGIPRELTEAARMFRERGGSLTDVTFHGLDLDAGVLDEARSFAEHTGLGALRTHHGDALQPSAYVDRYDFITSTGLGEFLNDECLARFYGVLYDVLRPGGVFVTSSMQRRLVSDYLLRLAELETHYRSPEQLREAAVAAGFRDVEVSMDVIGIQTLMLARK